ncbi:HEME-HALOPEROXIDASE domain-containing protein [Mycena chlorophos]|uniref:HEME-HALOPEROXIDASE domain-containing protein n=1 Tax=Mycena chlorophos TaxID=658473 RepID=A0A8H6VY92_MYCCL|nr:HEME-HALOPEROXIDASE domain-containing protein [Mycena chlorophos]
MLVSMPFSLLAFVAVAVAYREPAGHEYQKPGPNDSRSPCPGLNALANHGYLPRSGENMTVPQILSAAKQGFNMNWDVIQAAAKQGLLSRDDEGSDSVLSLEPLALHGLIEIDGSHSRDDYRDGTGDNLHFNSTIYNSWLAVSNPGVDYYNTTSAGWTMYHRLQYSLQTNPNVTNAQHDVFGRAGTSALYLSVMGNTTSGVAKKEFVDIFFREERLPFLEGWSPSKILITAASVGALVPTIFEASNWTQTDHCEPIVLGPNSIFNTAA